MLRSAPSLHSARIQSASRHHACSDLVTIMHFQTQGNNCMGTTQTAHISTPKQLPCATCRRLASGQWWQCDGERSPATDPTPTRQCAGGLSLTSRVLVNLAVMPHNNGYYEKKLLQPRGLCVVCVSLCNDVVCSEVSHTCVCDTGHVPYAGAAQGPRQCPCRGTGCANECINQSSGQSIIQSFHSNAAMQ